jgi:hypothetical protein
MSEDVGRWLLLDRKYYDPQLGRQQKSGIDDSLSGRTPMPRKTTQLTRLFHELRRERIRFSYQLSISRHRCHVLQPGPSRPNAAGRIEQGLVEHQTAESWIHAAVS